MCCVFVITDVLLHHTLQFAVTVYFQLANTKLLVVYIPAAFSRSSYTGHFSSKLFFLFFIVASDLNTTTLEFSLPSHFSKGGEIDAGTTERSRSVQVAELWSILSCITTELSLSHCIWLGWTRSVSPTPLIWEDQIYDHIYWSLNRTTHPLLYCTTSSSDASFHTKVYLHTRHWKWLVQLTHLPRSVVHLMRYRLI